MIVSVPGVVDVFNGIVISGPSFIVTVDAARALIAGLNPAEVRGQLETIMRGREESKIQKGEKLIGIRVRFPDAYRTDVDMLEKLQFINSNGVFVPLRNIARIQKTSGQAELHRERLRQLVAVTGRISHRDLGSTIDDIKKKLSRDFHLPKGMMMEYGGVYQTQESFRGSLLVAIAAFMLVFIVLLFEFGEFAVPVSIFVVNVLSLFGVLGALWITGVTFNISSFVGVIMIIGIVAENAIFVLHQVKNTSRPGNGR